MLHIAYDSTEFGQPTKELIDEIFRDAIDLTVAVRDFVAANSDDSKLRNSGTQYRQVTQVTSLLTVRILEIVAWLAAFKAVKAGEISARILVGGSFRVSAWDAGWHEKLEDTGMASGPLSCLISRTRELHRRARRLDV